jgi:ribosomal protein L11 methyltransferase
MISKNYIQLQFIIASAAQNEILIALLANIGFEGFEESDNLLSAFIAEENFDKEALAAIVSSQSVNYTSSVVAQQNWNAQWESSFEPVIINDFAAIRAGFHAPVQNVQHEVIITPKMSFGTGHHATTYLMIAQMAKINFANKTVLDFGTGTGVLAILAQKLGANEILAIDNDDWSIENAKENLLLNEAENIVIKKAETVTINKTYDVILANINLNVILANMKLISNACSKEATILLSGFLLNDVEAIKESMITNGLIFNYLEQKKDWVCVVATSG